MTHSDFRFFLHQVSGSFSLHKDGCLNIDCSVRKLRETCCLYNNTILEIFVRVTTINQPPLYSQRELHFSAIFWSAFVIFLLFFFNSAKVNDILTLNLIRFFPFTERSVTLCTSVVIFHETYLSENFWLHLQTINE